MKIEFWKQICTVCGKEYIPTTMTQKYCGSYRRKEGCSYIVVQKKQAELRDVYKKPDWKPNVNKTKSPPLKVSDLFN